MRAHFYQRIVDELPRHPRFALGLISSVESWVHQPFLFLGMIGSSRKWRMIREGFIKTGVATAAELNRVRCPVGVEIDAVSVQEIAVSIMAQYIQKRHAFSFR